MTTNIYGTASAILRTLHRAGEDLRVSAIQHRLSKGQIGLMEEALHLLTTQGEVEVYATRGGPDNRGGRPGRKVRALRPAPPEPHCPTCTCHDVL